jgi:hypothetical protein
MRARPKPISRRNDPPASGAAGRRVRLLLVAALLGFVLRVVISLCSWGTTDAVGFLRFGFLLRAKGLIAGYREDPQLNHPPIPPYWARLALGAIDPHDGAAEFEDTFWFAPLFRTPMILSDVLAAWVLWRIWRGRGGSEAAAAGVVAMYAWNPVAILVSGYHGNTDSVYACLSLLAVYLLQDRGRAFWGGIALGAAINVKLIPVLLILPLALSLRRRQDLLRFIAGLAVCALPFVPPLVLATSAFWHNALAYKSLITLWGVQFFLLMPHPPTEAAPDKVSAAARWYWEYGRYVLLAAVCAWAVIARVAGRRGAEGECEARWDRYAVAAMAYALFIVLAPGFGVQYLVVLVPLLYAVSPRFANVYGIVAGAFLLAAYDHYSDWTFPFSSLFDSMFPVYIGVIGLAPWALLVCFIVGTLVFSGRTAGSKADAASV